MSTGRGERAAEGIVGTRLESKLPLKGMLLLLTCFAVLQRCHAGSHQPPQDPASDDMVVCNTPLDVIELVWKAADPATKALLFTTVKDLRDRPDVVAAYSCWELTASTRHDSQVAVDQLVSSWPRVATSVVPRRVRMWFSQARNAAAALTSALQLNGPKLSRLYMAVEELDITRDLQVI